MKSGAGGRGSGGDGDEFMLGGGGGGGGSSRAAVPDFQISEGFKDEAIDGGYISSDLDEPESGERRPIETIDLISEDEDEGTAPFSAPIRLSRIEHRARTVHVNPETGEGEAIKTEDGDVTMADAPEASRAKSKQQDKSLDITKEQPFRGVWRDEPIIKEEPSVEQPPARIRGPSKENDENAEPATRRSKQSTPKTPVFFNEEERKEYLRTQADNEVMVSEFGDIEAHKEDTRTYLFQFPPVLPNLAVQKPITIKDDPDAPANQQTNGTSSTANNKDAPIKIEDGETDPLKPDDLVKDSTVRPKHLPQLASGSVGKLRVHKSGKVTMDWGGSAFVVQNGVAPDFLQNLVMLRMDKQTPAEAAAAVSTTMMGSATAFGQPRGKLVVQPDWDAMLEGAVKGMKVE
jgi:DNA-directed RNA polymerase III subunit RPC4